ncbi:SLAP domain-containing protein [Lactobacillus sp. R2/2]|nr:SLAP domain-containing protein [Lactobacillus sp. R2/2]
MASQVVVVQAANKTTAKKKTTNKNTIKLSHNAYVYDKNGKTLEDLHG